MVLRGAANTPERLSIERGRPMDNPSVHAWEWKAYLPDGPYLPLLGSAK
jgi:hypothetical protein